MDSTRFQSESIRVGEMRKTQETQGHILRRLDSNGKIKFPLELICVYWTFTGADQKEGGTGVGAPLHNFLIIIHFLVCGPLLKSLDLALH